MQSPILYQKSGRFLTGGSLGKMESDTTRKRKQSHDMDIHIGQTDFVFYTQDKHAPRAVYNINIEEPTRRRTCSHSSLLSDLQEDNSDFSDHIPITFTSCLSCIRSITITGLRCIVM